MTTGKPNDSAARKAPGRTAPGAEAVPKAGAGAAKSSSTTKASAGAARAEAAPKAGSVTPKTQKANAVKPSASSTKPTPSVGKAIATPPRAKASGGAAEGGAKAKGGKKGLAAKDPLAEARGQLEQEKAAAQVLAEELRQSQEAERAAREELARLQLMLRSVLDTITPAVSNFVTDFHSLASPPPLALPAFPRMWRRLHL